MNKARPQRGEQKKAFKRDSALIRKILRGDEVAFATLMSLYKKRVEVLGMSFFKNSEDAKDFVQDVFIKCFTKISTFKGRSLFSTWLMSIAYNTAKDAANRRKEYLSIADESVLQDPSFSPEERELRKLTKEAVRECIKELNEKYRVALDMYFFYDNSYSEISEITGLAEGTVKSHIFRAKKILRKKLAAKGLDK